MVKKKMKFEISKHIGFQVNRYSEAENFKDGVNWRDYNVNVQYSR